MLSANFKPKRTAAASRIFLATARLSFLFALIFKILLRDVTLHLKLKHATAEVNKSAL